MTDKKDQQEKPFELQEVHQTDIELNGSSLTQGTSNSSVAELDDSELERLEKRSVFRKSVSSGIQLGILIALLATIPFASIQIKLATDASSLMMLGFQAMVVFVLFLALVPVFEMAKLYLLEEVLCWILIPIGFCASAFSKEAATVCWWFPARLYEITGRYGFACWLWRRGLPTRAGDESQRAFALAILSVASAKSGSVDDGRELAREAVKNAEVDGTKDGFFKTVYSNLVQSLIAQGIMYEFDGNYQQALEQFQNAEEVCDRRGIETPQTLLLCYARIGNASSMLGDYKTAKIWLDRAEKLHHEKSRNIDTASYSFLLLCRGILALRTECFLEADSYIKRSISMRIDLPNTAPLAESYFWLARLHKHQGSLNLAEKYCTKALRFCNSAFESRDSNPISIRKELISILSLQGRNLESEKLVCEIQQIHSTGLLLDETPCPFDAIDDDPHRR